jgi:hypothetical protein
LRRAISTGVLLTACSRSPGDRLGNDGREQPTHRAYEQRARAESLFLRQTTDTVYRRRLLDLIRRSRLVPTDSLAQLYLRLSKASDAELPELRRQYPCMFVRISSRYGSPAAERAAERMIDSLTQTGVDRNAVDTLIVSGPGGPISISKSTCGRDVFDTSLPDSLAIDPEPTRSPSH